MTQQQLQYATSATTANAARFLQYITDTCAHNSINTPIRQLCFLAQLGHESGGLHYTEELASGAAYEGRASLGNTQPGDGIRFKGRGLIQITGRSNYSICGRDLGADLVSNPTLLGGKTAEVCTPDQLKYAAQSAAWFWHRNHLNEIADQINISTPIDAGTNLDHFRQITHVINGGYNGLPDRLARYQAGHSYF